MRARCPARAGAVLAVLAALLFGQLAAVGPRGGATSATPVAPRQNTVELSLPTGPVTPSERTGIERPSSPARFSPVTAVPGGVGVVGVQWSGGALAADALIEVRVRSGGQWGQWEPLDRGEEHRPDSGSAEARAAQTATTDPYAVVGDAVQLRAVPGDAALPLRVSGVLVDPGRSDADQGIGAVAGAAGADARRPTIYSRAAWGADESLRTSAPVYEQAHVGFVHHTAGSNSYTADQVPAIIRGIYAYHVNSQGWTDIGYNALVDRFGRIWEGRAGGLDRAVSGAHTYMRNGESFGVSAIGTFETGTPPSGMLSSIADYLAWKMTVHGLPVTGSAIVNGDSFNRISGHRDAYQTSCPGAALYAQLGTLRTMVAARMGAVTTTHITRSFDAGGTPDLLYAGPSQWQGYPGAASEPWLRRTSFGTRWRECTLVAATPDMTGDGRADVAATCGDRLRVSAGDGTGGFSDGNPSGSGWASVTYLLAGGDRTGDGRADLLGVTESGAVYLHPGTGDGGTSARVSVGSGWQAYTSFTATGDVTGDGISEIAALRLSDGHLVRFPSAAGGGVQRPVDLGSGWLSRFSSVIGTGDLDRDGLRGDLLAIEGSGRVRTYFSAPEGSSMRTVTWGRGWGWLSELSSGVDLTADGTVDLLGRDRTTGTMYLYHGSGVRDFGAPPVDLARSLGSTGLLTLVRVVGDVTGDGRADVVGRSQSGTLWFFPSQAGGFGTPVSLGGGWGAMDLIEPAGDLTRDGVPDILARTSAGELQIYTLRRTPTARSPWIIPVGSGWSDLASIVGVGAINSDFNGDVAALRRSDGAILLYRGAGPGSLNTYVVAVKGQTDLVRLHGLGDLTGDGRDDVVGETSGGRLWVYPGTGSTISSTRQPLLAPKLGALSVG